MAVCLEQTSWFYKVQRTLLAKQMLNYQEGFPLYLGTVSEYLSTVWSLKVDSF
jgi:hypothetical protein